MAEFMKLEDYASQKPNNPYPDSDQDPKLKRQKDYVLQLGRAMLSDFTSNSCELLFSFGEGKRTFKELHQYATGTYSNEKLKDRVIGTTKGKKKNGKHITKMNISWDTFPVLAKFNDITREKNMRQDYDVDAECIDDDSIQAKEADKAVLKYLISDDVQELMKITKFKPNMKLDPQAIGLVTEQDVDLYFETGGYPFQREIATIAACNKTKLVSKYKVIQDQTFDDLIKFGIAGWKYYFDKASATVKMRKVDIYNPELGYTCVILPYSQTNDFDNLSRVGEIRVMTVADVRKEYPHLTAPEIIQLAQSYSYLNPSYTAQIAQAGQYSESASGFNLGGISRCKILVLDYQWLDVDIDNYVKNDSRTLFKAVDFDYKLDGDAKRKGDRKIQKQTVKKFEATWVIGTSILLKNDIAEDIIYYGPDGDRCPSLDYFFTKTGVLPLVERSIAIQDDIDLANVKLRSALSSAIPAPRMVVQQGLLDNVYMNGIKVEPGDNMSTFKELGYLIVNAVDDDGKPIFSNQKLVDFLPMGVQEDVNTFMGQIVAGINNLRELWGLAQGADGSTPQKYDGFKKTELSQQNSNAALFPTFNCYQYLFENGFTHAVKMWQIIAKDRNIKLNYSPLGRKNLQILSLDKEFSNSDLNIGLILGSTNQELQQLMADIAQMRQTGIQTNFQQGITTAEYLYLSETIKSGNTKQAMWVMAKIEQKKIADQKAVDQQNQENNASAQQNSAAQAELNKQDTARIEATEERKTIVLRAAEERKTAAVSAVLKDFAKEGGASAEPLYNQIMAAAQVEVDSVLQMDAQAQQQQGQGGQQPQPGQQPGQQPAPPDQQMQQSA